MSAWHKLLITEAASILDTDVEPGLSGNKAKQRLVQYGQNKLRKGKQFFRPLKLLQVSLKVWLSGC